MGLYQSVQKVMNRNLKADGYEDPSPNSSGLLGSPGMFPCGPWPEKKMEEGGKTFLWNKSIFPQKAAESSQVKCSGADRSPRGLQGTQERDRPALASAPSSCHAPNLDSAVYSLKKSQGYLFPACSEGRVRGRAMPNK